ncbi:hypothetical protein [Flavobacterium sp.]|uniref:hypothetical protein n=1 Tax=Flavobacterium sp. TaxID=239 RepID=UPI003752FBED
MDANFNNILVFATNIKSKADKEFISDILNKNTVIQQWSIDQEDIDCVLRIVSGILTAIDIIKIINTLGFNCNELE